MINNIKNSHIYITHGGPCSIVQAWQHKKIPIVDAERLLAAEAEVELLKTDKKTLDGLIDVAHAERDNAQSQHVH